MKNLRSYIFIVTSALCVACTTTTHIATTQNESWIVPQNLVAEQASEPLVINIETSNTDPEVLGFGGCFNEMGWASLSQLNPSDCDAIMRELFAPGEGANFNICRMPLGANDFSLDWYSYNETKDDFEQANFSIEQDKSTLIPFIKAAQSYKSDLKIWASPWCPPSWFKHNGHYASSYNGWLEDSRFHNGLAKDNEGKPGTDMFIQEPKYLESYALYFEKFIKAYRAEGIDIFAVMPQNEFYALQSFPSCGWLDTSLAQFACDYLGPRMENLGVDVMYGTVHSGDVALADRVMAQNGADQYIKGFGFQWGGKSAVAGIHKNYPDLTLFQTEQECGNGKNDWEGLTHSWGLLKSYFDSGVSAYMYWNISLENGGVSRWGWAQNSLVVVDTQRKEYKFTYEYYLMKHISHFVAPSSRRIVLDSPNAIAFATPEGKTVVLVFEEQGVNRQVDINVDGKTHSVVVPANSVNTIVI